VKQSRVPDTADAKSPAGADISFLMDGATGNMIHASVPAGQINRATRHKTVSEFWFVLEGKGKIWRSDGNSQSVVDLEPGVSIDIPVGTAFQYRSDENQFLKFICISMPPWPGDDEAEYVDGIWQETIDA